MKREKQNLNYFEMKIARIKKECHDANLKLSKSILSFQNFGNISKRIDKDKFIIKPSGADLDKTKYSDYPVISISKRKKISGKLKESSDTPTHLILYDKYPDLNAIAHAHAKYSVIWAQALNDIPICGTTHADYWREKIFVTNKLRQEKIKKNYEENIGKSIIGKLGKRNPLKYPGILVANHGPFSWGKDAIEALQNLERLEFIAELAFKTKLLNNKKTLISTQMVKKHYDRKNGIHAYYGQKNK